MAAYVPVGCLLLLLQGLGQLVSVQPGAMASGRRGPLRAGWGRTAGAVALVLAVALLLLLPVQFLPGRYGATLGAAYLVMVGAAGVRVGHSRGGRARWGRTWAVAPAGSTVEFGTLFSAGQGGARRLCWAVFAYARAAGWTLAAVPATQRMAETFQRWGFEPVDLAAGAGRPYLRRPETPLPPNFDEDHPARRSVGPDAG